MNETCTIAIPAKKGIVDPRYCSLFSEASAEYIWPRATTSQGEIFDVSRVPPPTHKTCTLHYVTELEDGTVRLANPRDNVDVTLSFPKDILNCVWLFLAYGGWRSMYNAVIEPSTSYPYDLAQAIREGPYSKLELGEKLSCSVRVTLGPHCE